MKWIDADYRFDVPSKCFVIPMRDLPQCRVDNAKEAYELARSLLDQHRPDLCDAVVFGVDMLNQRLQFKIFVAHPSFPGVPPGTLSPEEPLCVT